MSKNTIAQKRNKESKDSDKEGHRESEIKGD